MTRGEMLFYAGAALLVVTVILAIIFIIRKPRYIPGGYRGGLGETTRLQNAYPTDRFTQGYPHSQEQEIYHPDPGATELLPETELIQEAATEPESGMARPSDGTHDTAMIWDEN